MLHVDVFFEEFLTILNFMDTPPCSTILGLTGTLLSFLISSAIRLQDFAIFPCGVAGQNMGKLYVSSPLFPFLYQLIFFTFSLSSLFHVLCLYRGLSSFSSRLYYVLSVFGVVLCIWCCILPLNSDNCSAFLVNGNSRLVFSKILTANWISVAFLILSGTVLRLVSNSSNAIGFV